MRIRRATPDDVPAVLPMVRKICELHAAWDPEKYTLKGDPTLSYGPWLKRQAQDPRSAFFVADPQAGTTLAGFLIGAIEHDIPIYRVVEVGFVHDLWVEPEHRGAGVGRALMNAAIEHFKAQGVEQVRLETAAPNDAARKLFRELGFHEFAATMLKTVSTRGEETNDGR